MTGAAVSGKLPAYTTRPLVGRVFLYPARLGFRGHGDRVRRLRLSARSAPSSGMAARWFTFADRDFQIRRLLLIIDSYQVHVVVSWPRLTHKKAYVFSGRNGPSTRHGIGHRIHQ